MINSRSNLQIISFIGQLSPSGESKYNIYSTNSNTVNNNVNINNTNTTTTTTNTTLP